MILMRQKPQLKFAQIWSMSFGFLGIQFGFALQNANVSRIFETLGASIDTIPLLWIAAPTTGLLVQPIIGHMSDRTWNVFGRRRPYFLVGAILSTMALFIMPNSPALWVAAIMLWILDASINISMEPFRALVGDMLPSSQRTVGFAVQSFFIGTGAIIASALPYILTNYFNVANTAATGEIPPSVKISFYLGAIAFLGAVLWTVIRTKEYSPEELAQFRPEGSAKEEENTEGLFEIFKDFVKMPKTMRQLAVVQFLSWFALFSMWIYTTKAVTSHIYGTTDPTSALYNEGANWVGICFAAYNGFAALCAFLLPPLAKLTSRRVVHLISLVAGGVGLASIFFITNPTYVLLSMIGVGLAWASILAMPYAMLSDALPPMKMGVYMGIFNFFIVIPQILAASTWGFLTRYLFEGKAIYALMCGGLAMVLAGFCCLFVDDASKS